MAFDPFEVSGRGAFLEKEGCHFEQVRIFYADPSNVFPGVQMSCESVDGVF